MEVLDRLGPMQGEEIGVSDWMEITQERVDAFAEATGDHQWIHVDPERAKAGPFGTTIAHGYLSLSLTPMLLHKLIQVEDAKMGINYGANKIRFTNPVSVGSQVRLHAKLLGGEAKGNDVLYRIECKLEIKDQERPAFVGELLYYAVG